MRRRDKRSIMIDATTQREEPRRGDDKEQALQPLQEDSIAVAKTRRGLKARHLGARRKI